MEEINSFHNMKLSALKQNSNQKIAILGYGKEGKSVLQFLEKIEYPKDNITLIDRDSIKEKNYTTISGENYLDNLKEYDVIFKSPGISPYHEKLRQLRDTFTSGAHIFFDNYQGKVIGVTATKGKSTTSTLIYKILEHSGYKVKLVGNIGKPVLDEIDIISGETYDYIVYELSSYMLENLEPNLEIGLLGNIYSDHIDWHINKQNYVQAKKNILSNAKHKCVGSQIISEVSNNDVLSFGTQGNYTYKDAIFYKEKTQLFDTTDILLKGEHNYYNICGAICVCDILGISIENILEAIKSFSGLPHRMDIIGSYNEITFIDDSISTTPESTIAAIQTFGDNIDTIFLGGTDRGYDFQELGVCISQYNIKNIVLFPDSGNKILQYVSKDLNIIQTSSMKEAVNFAYTYTKKGSICLLSTASPSYSVWKNYMQKAKLFKQEIT
ncbi:UDP-N-acetylmuramoyl-L-alanine--D-glutamate ligase [Candidatus Gracilibacteria bacterium]|nr:UDP-N-acetylmuramoyl-L-alanine--D-glutamate ligase [Candidatus Gracilibacteria bacterium]